MSRIIKLIFSEYDPFRKYVFEALFIIVCIGLEGKASGPCKLQNAKGKTEEELWMVPSELSLKIPTNLNSKWIPCNSRKRSKC